MYNFHMQTNSPTLSLIPYFKVITGRQREYTPQSSHTKFHLSNKITFISNHSPHSISSNYIIW